MKLRILHTADVHIGMTFTRGYPPEVQEALVEARFNALERLVQEANERQCHLFVVAGDLFHRQRIPRRDLLRVAEILNRFEGNAFLLLPGNHDFYHRSESSLWQTLEAHLNERAVVLKEPRIYSLEEHDLGLHVYPAPCTAKHSSKNALGWMHSVTPAPEVPFHLGVAHGSLAGFSPDFEERYYPMTRQELEEIPVQAWLLGHTHLRFPKNESGSEERIFFPATPEPDGFDCHHNGSAWFLEIEESGAVYYQALTTGFYRFQEVTVELSESRGIQPLLTLSRNYPPARTLLKLHLTGRVSSDLLQEIRQEIGRLHKAFFYVEVDTTRLLRRITQEDIDREFVEGSFAHRLLRQLENEDELALQMAYEIIREMQE